jgi:tripartite-type tricarboxylate transporter receptor subunit TctC
MSAKFALALTLMIIVSGSAWAQGYPDRPITLIVPTSAGGTTDTMARIFAPPMSKILGQEIVVENLPGAGNVIGTKAVADAKPDGYTIGMGANSGLAISPLTNPDLGYDPITSFVPVHYFANVVNGLVVNAGLGPKTMDELIAYAKAHPGELNYSSGGTGTTSHFAGAMFAGFAGISDVTEHIPYQGGSQASVAAAAGEVQFYVGPLAGNLMGVVDSKKVIPLAVSGKKRISVLPDVQTFAEAGMPEYTAVGFFGLIAPAGTPQDIVTKLNDAGNEAAKLPEVLDALKAQGIEPVDATPVDYGAQIKDELEKNRKLIEDGVVTLQEK